MLSCLSLEERGRGRRRGRGRKKKRAAKFFPSNFSPKVDTRRSPSGDSCCWAFHYFLVCLHINRLGRQKDEFCDASLSCFERTSARSLSFLQDFEQSVDAVSSREKTAVLGVARGFAFFIVVLPLPLQYLAIQHILHSNGMLEM